MFTSSVGGVLVGHTPFTEEDTGPPELPLHTHVKHAKAYGPGENPFNLAKPVSGCCLLVR